MTLLLLAWLSFPNAAAQEATPLSFDVRVFDGTTEVTPATRVTIHDAGTRDAPRQVPLAPNGERQLTLPSGRYDVQFVHEDAGRVLRVRWTSLRLLVGYPGAHGRQLEVFNMRPGYGALQVRRAGSSPERGPVRWTATLREAGGGVEVGTPVAGDGYLLFVTRPGTYDLEIRTSDGETRWRRGVHVVEDLTYLHSWSETP